MANIFGQLIAAIFEKKTSDPSSLGKGHTYYNTTSNELKVHNGTSFKTVMDTDTAQVLSNKEHDVVTLSQQTTPSTPSAGKAKLYLKNDKKVYLLNESGVEKLVGPEIVKTTTAPTVSDDSTLGYAVGSMWLNTNTNVMYRASSVSTGVAVWEQLNYPRSKALSALDIDWNAGEMFYKTISADSTFTFSNVTEGRSVTLVITNSSGSTVSLAFPSGVYKTAGALPISAGQSALYSLMRINGITYLAALAGLATS
jgi:hypothetical protein